MAWLRALLVLAVLLALGCGTEKPKPPSGKAAPAPEPQGGAPSLSFSCTYRFYAVADAAEASRLRRVIEALAKDGQVIEIAGSDLAGKFIEYQFTLPSSGQVAKLDGVLRERAAAGSGQAPAAPLYEPIDLRLSASYMTAPGPLDTVVRFTVSPGASLFYSLGAGQETAVPREQIDPTGKVALTLRIPEGEHYLYVRSELGHAHRYLRINCQTGYILEVSAAEYERWRTTGSR